MVQNQSHGFPSKSRCLPRLSDGGGASIVGLRSRSYTHLKDLMPISPPLRRRIRWEDIPIKDPLVRFAAWAYLQPMEKERDDGGLFSLKRWKKMCCGLWGCFGDVVSVVGRSLFGEDSEGHEGGGKVDGKNSGRLALLCN